MLPESVNQFRLVGFLSALEHLGVDPRTANGLSRLPHPRINPMTNEELARQLAFPPGSEPRQKAEFELRLRELNAQTEAKKAQREAIYASGTRSAKAVERRAVQQDEMVAELQRYKRELEGILSRFV